MGNEFIALELCWVNYIYSINGMDDIAGYNIIFYQYSKVKYLFTIIHRIPHELLAIKSPITSHFWTL